MRLCLLGEVSERALASSQWVTCFQCSEGVEETLENEACWLLSAGRGLVSDVGSIPDPCVLHAEVSLSRTLNPKQLLKLQLWCVQLLVGPKWRFCHR